MTAAHYKGGHLPGNDLGLHYTALPPIVASCPYSDQLLVTRKFWSPGANRPSQASMGSTGRIRKTATCSNRTSTMGRDPYGFRRRRAKNPGIQALTRSGSTTGFLS